MNYSMAIAIEHQVARILQAQEEHGFKFNSILAASYLDRLEKRQIELLDEIRPQFGKRLVRITEIKKPFKNDGNLSVRAIKYGFTNPEVLGGAFSVVDFEDINIGSESQVKVALLENGWEPDSWNWKDTGQKKKIKMSPKITDSSLEAMGNKLLNNNLPELLREYYTCKHRISLVSGLLAAVSEDGRMHAGYSGYTKTFRIRHKVIVNLPRPQSMHGGGIRQMFEASEGKKLVGIDADQCQLRGLAHYLNDDKFTEMIVNGDKNKGTDVHSYVTGICDLPDRNLGKAVLYAMLFGASFKKVATMVGCTDTRAKQILKRVLSGIPRLKDVTEGMQRRLRSRGHLIAIDNRPVYIDYPHTCLVFMLQALEAIIMKWAMVHLDSWIKSHDLDAKFVIFMHDEFQLECDPSCAEQVGSQAAFYINGAANNYHLHCPQVGDYSIGNNWEETH